MGQEKRATKILELKVLIFLCKGINWGRVSCRKCALGRLNLLGLPTNQIKLVPLRRTLTVFAGKSLLSKCSQELNLLKLF